MHPIRFLHYQLTRSFPVSCHPWFMFSVLESLHEVHEFLSEFRKFLQDLFRKLDALSFLLGRRRFPDLWNRYLYLGHAGHGPFRIWLHYQSSPKIIIIAKHCPLSKNVLSGWLTLSTNQRMILQEECGLGEFRMSVKQYMLWTSGFCPIMLRIFFLFRIVVALACNSWNMKSAAL